MLEFLCGAPCLRMTDEDCDEDFEQSWSQVSNHDAWKLERRQHFQEPWFDSWRAFARGDWEEALRLGEARMGNLKAEAHRDEERNVRLRRVRVVELPLTPYLQWEMHGFRQRVATGELIKVITTDHVAAWETDGLLPELINVGPAILYETIYDTSGLPIAGARYDGEDIVSSYLTLMQNLFAQGEDFTTFFRREVEPLPPPPATGEALAREA